MTEERLRELMQRPAPGEHDAEHRSYEVARAAFETRSRTARGPLRIRSIAAVAATAAVVALAVGMALTPAGDAVADWIDDRLGGEIEGARPAQPALTSLPGGGELLVESPQGTWVVRSDGSQRLLGSYDDAAWSPHGLFAVGVSGHQLVALTPSGDVRWSLTRPAVNEPRWSPSGLRIAYLSGRLLRIVEGDGSDDHLVARRIAPTPPAWRPRGEDAVAFAHPNGQIELFAAATQKSLWRSRAGEVPLELEWSGDGERLVAVGPRTIRVFHDGGRTLNVIRLPNDTGKPSGGGHMAEFGRSGHRFALIRESRTAGQSEVVLLKAERRPGEPSRLFSGPGRFSGLAWSPDGDSLLVTWPSADQWLFLRRGRPASVKKAISNISHQFAPGQRGPDGPLELRGWCCRP